MPLHLWDTCPVYPKLLARFSCHIWNGIYGRAAAIAWRGGTTRSRSIVHVMPGDLREAVNLSPYAWTPRRGTISPFVVLGHMFQDVFEGRDIPGCLHHHLVPPVVPDEIGFIITAHESRQGVHRVFDRHPFAGPCRYPPAAYTGEAGTQKLNTEASSGVYSAPLQTDCWRPPSL